jgi:hypothetical protein
MELSPSCVANNHSASQEIPHLELEVKVKLYLCFIFLTKHHSMKAYWEVEV